MKSKRTYYILKLFIYLSIFLIILFYTLFLLNGGGGIDCIYTSLFNRICPSCGATRSVLSILSFDIKSGVGYNPVISLAILPISAVYIVSDIVATIINISRKDNYILSPIVWLFKKGGK